MSKKIAVITGASSGMGRMFVETISQLEEELDEVWVIARRKERLESLHTDYPLKVIPLDLTNRNSYNVYCDLLQAEEVEVRLLVNASGYGKFDAIMKIDLETNLNMVDLNVQALQAFSQLTIPYMTENSHILNIASLAAFQPVPYLGVYAATKAFVLSYSRALNQELKKSKIHVMALCPYWTKTEFFKVANEGNHEGVITNFIVMYEAKDVVNRAWRDLKRNQDVCLYGTVSKGQAFLCKILPHSLVMKIWLKQQHL